MTTTSFLRVCTLNFLRIGVWVCLLSLILSVQPLHSMSAQSSEPDDRPNIIFILTDDQAAHTLTYMPVLQRELIEKGVTFSNAFTVSPVCCPARTSILRGQYVHTHRLIANEAPFGGISRFEELNLGDSTVATWLQSAGYRTALVGKYLNQYSQPPYRNLIPVGWDEWYAWIYGRKNESYYVNFAMNENGQIIQYPKEDGGYTTDLFRDISVDFIHSAAEDDKPFFLFLSFLAPHNPMIPAPRHTELYKNLKAPVSAAFNEEDVSDKPNWMRNKAKFTKSEINKINTKYRDHVLTLLAVDEAIEAILKELESNGQLDNTYIVFTTDNGYHFGQHRLMPNKGTAYTEDIRIPLVIRGPGVPQNTVDDRIVANIDFAPTFAEIAGADAPEFVDGRSLMSLLNANDGGIETPAWRKSLLITYLCPRKADVIVKPDRPGICFNQIRNTRYIYTEYPSTGEQELYDLSKDPAEINNLLAPQSTDTSSKQNVDQIRRAYRSLLNALLKCNVETCWKREERFVP